MKNGSLKYIIKDKQQMQSADVVIETTNANTDATGTGVVLIALGNPQYGRMAANLAASLRFSDKEINIHLVYSGSSLSHLTPEHKALFSSMAECPAEYYTKNEKTVYLKAKTYIYELSPFEETILMDVDLVWFATKPVSQLLEELKQFDFTMQNRGFFDLSKNEVDEHYSMWCNISEVKHKYETDGRFYQLASELIYFKRTEENKKYFGMVREVFDNPQVNTMVHSKGKKIADGFGGDIPDELAFDIASCVLKKYPHQENFVPVFWFSADKAKDMNEIMKNHYGYSIGGNVFPAPVLKRYTGLCRFYAKALGLPFHYNVHPKRQWLPERKKI